MKTHHIAYSDILDIIQTQDEAKAMVTQLGLLIDNLYAAKQDVRERILQYVSYDKKEKIVALIMKNGVDIQNAVELQKFFIDLQTAIHEIPIVTLTLAFEPKQEFLASISSWFVIHTKKAVLLDILEDTRLGGGAIIEYRGSHRDYSLLKMLREKKEKGELHIGLA